MQFCFTVCIARKEPKESVLKSIGKKPSRHFRLC